jgi:hypothetical protein
MYTLHLEARRLEERAPRAASEIMLRSRELARLQARERLRERPRAGPERPHRFAQGVARLRARRWRIRVLDA